MGLRRWSVLFLITLLAASCRTPKRDRGPQSADPGPILHWINIDGPETLWVGDCERYRLFPRTSTGQPLSKELTFPVRAIGSAELYKDEACAESITQTTLGAGNLETSVFLKARRGQIVTLVVAPPALPSTSLNVDALAESSLEFLPSPVQLPAQEVGEIQFFTLALTNQGKGTARELHLLSPLAPFAFAGGTYPGVGGTCGAQLEDGAECVFALSVSPTQAGEFSADFQLGYRDDAQAGSITAQLHGEATAQDRLP